LFFQQCADIGRRYSNALLARADFLGNTDNHLRYPRCGSQIISYQGGRVGNPAP
jgi:hypothetical protein